MEAEWSEEIIRECMARFDANADGSLCMAEFEHALAELSRTKPGKKKGKKKAKGKSQGDAMLGAAKAQLAQAELIAGVAGN